MTTEELLKERGNDYGAFENQVEAIKKIMNTLRELRSKKTGSRSMYIEDEDVENFFLVLKLCRLQTSNKLDDINDLIGYATLIKERRFGK